MARFTSEEQSGLEIYVQQYPINQAIRDGKWVITGGDHYQVGSQEQARALIMGFVSGYFCALARTKNCFISKIIKPFYAKKALYEEQGQVLEEIKKRGIDMERYASQYDPVVFAYIPDMKEKKQQIFENYLEVHFQMEHILKPKKIQGRE